MVGGCDLEQAAVYLEKKYEIHKEFATVIDGKEIRTSDLFQLLNSIDLDCSEKDKICEHLPFCDKRVTFATRIFSGKYDTIVISVVDDYIRGVWKHKNKGYYVGYGGYYDQEEFLSNLSKQEFDYLKSNYDFIGKEPKDEFKTNLVRILDLIGDKPQVLIINGIELDISDWIGADRVKRNQEMNSVVDNVIKGRKNVELIDMRKIVTNKRALIKRDNRHFNRVTYFNMAELISIAVDNKKISKLELVMKSTAFFLAKAIRRIKKAF